MKMAIPQNPILRVYSWYYKTIAAPFSWIRGVTRIRFILADLALRSILKPCNGGYEYDYYGIPIKLCRKEHFQELILEVDLIEGYCGPRGIREDDVVVDSGTYPGEFTIYAARKASRVIALEPNEENANTLIENLKLNDLNNVEVIRKALWSFEGDMAFARKGLNFSVDPNGSSIVPVTTLDAIARDHDLDRLDFVKMDVEGAEIQALKGSQKVLQLYRPFFAIASYHEINGSKTYPIVERFLTEYGYNVKTGYAQHLTTYGWK
jgi:FkbM family methyltransferase